MVRTGRGIAAVARKPLARAECPAYHHCNSLSGAAQMFKDLLAPLYLFFKGLGAVAAHADVPGAGLGASVKRPGAILWAGSSATRACCPDSNVHPALCMLAVFVTVWNRTMARPYALVAGELSDRYVANERCSTSQRGCDAAHQRHAVCSQDSRPSSRPIPSP